MPEESDKEPKGALWVVADSSHRAVVEAAVDSAGRRCTLPNQLVQHIRHNRVLVEVPGGLPTVSRQWREDIHIVAGQNGPNLE